MINAYFFDSVNNDRPYSGADFAKAFGIILETGVVAGDSDGSLGFDLTGVNYSTIKAGKAVVAGHFIENDSDFTITGLSGSYSGMLVIRVNITDTRKASFEMRTDQIPQQDQSIYELPLYNCTVTNGVITAVTDLRVQGGAIAKPAANVVTWSEDPSGVYLNIGSHNGKIYRLFLTANMPGEGGTGERRAWIQMDF